MKVDVDPQVKHFPFATKEVLRTCARTPAVATVFDVNSIGDGTYDVVVIDADEVGDDTLVLELVVSSGLHRGEIVRVNARGLGRTWVDVLGVAGTLVVTDGRPRVALD
jgi:hypothetical protein